MNDQPATAITPEEDLNNRVKGFNEELIPLLAKYKLGLGATPFITDKGQVAARPSIFNDDNPKDVASPENTPTDNSPAEATPPVPDAPKPEDPAPSPVTPNEAKPKA